MARSGYGYWDAVKTAVQTDNLRLFQEFQIRPLIPKSFLSITFMLYDRTLMNQSYFEQILEEKLKHTRGYLCRWSGITTKYVEKV
jgi:hypothetical protein